MSWEDEADPDPWGKVTSAPKASWEDEEPEPDLDTTPVALATPSEATEAAKRKKAENDELLFSKQLEVTKLQEETPEERRLRGTASFNSLQNAINILSS